MCWRHDKYLLPVCEERTTLQRFIYAMAERICGQSELLSKRAERMDDDELKRLRLTEARYRDLELKCAAQAVEIAGLRMEVERGHEAVNRMVERLNDARP